MLSRVVSFKTCVSSPVGVSSIVPTGNVRLMGSLNLPKVTPSNWQNWHWNPGQFSPHVCVLSTLPGRGGDINILFRLLLGWFPQISAGEFSKTKNVLRVWSVSAACIEEERVGREGEVGGEGEKELASSFTDLIEP